MSIFLPYSITEVVSKFSEWFSLDLSNLTAYESITITILANMYFFIFWGFILWCILKGLNWVYERLF